MWQQSIIIYYHVYQIPATVGNFESLWNSDTSFLSWSWSIDSPRLQNRNKKKEHCANAFTSLGALQAFTNKLNKRAATLYFYNLVGQGGKVILWCIEKSTTQLHVSGNFVHSFLPCWWSTSKMDQRLPRLIRYHKTKEGSTSIMSYFTSLCRSICSQTSLSVFSAEAEWKAKVNGGRERSKKPKPAN